MIGYLLAVLFGVCIGISAMHAYEWCYAAKFFSWTRR